MIRADSRLVSSQWETSLQSNAISHWLGTTLESALMIMGISRWKADSQYPLKFKLESPLFSIKLPQIEAVILILTIYYNQVNAL